MSDGTSEALLQAIVVELERIGASPWQAGERDSIGVNDERDGWASLGASEERRDLYWYGRAELILERLAALPTDAGAAAIRQEFDTDVPERLRGSS
jgi:hypothetical protein